MQGWKSAGTLIVPFERNYKDSLKGFGGFRVLSVWGLGFSRCGVKGFRVQGSRGSGFQVFRVLGDSRPPGIWGAGLFRGLGILSEASFMNSSAGGGGPRSGSQRA